MSFNNIREARYAYSYYKNKVDSITDLSDSFTLADNSDFADLSNLNEGGDALSNLNDIDINKYHGYIALIDTGANADVNFSVVGDDTSDSHGHGTKMFNFIKEENPDAKIMSIKVFNGSTTSAEAVYAGIMLAIESEVEIINLSFVGSNVAKNQIVADAIQMALDKGITVIGAAGNYNSDAKLFIPGCIDGVITVGAINNDETKLSTSNFNADLYVTANSTSEAAARYTGIYTYKGQFAITYSYVVSEFKGNTHDDKKSYRRGKVIFPLKLSLDLEKV